MKIEFINGVAGQRFAYEAGDEADLPEDQAKAFIRQGVAVPAGQGAQSAAHAGAPERAAGRGGRRTIKNLGGLLRE